MEIWQALYLSCIPFVVLAVVCGFTAAGNYRNRPWVVAAMMNISVASILFLVATWTGIGT